MKKKSVWSKKKLNDISQQYNYAIWNWVSKSIPTSVESIPCWILYRTKIFPKFHISIKIGFFFLTRAESFINRTQTNAKEKKILLCAPNRNIERKKKSKPQIWFTKCLAKFHKS